MFKYTEFITHSIDNFGGELCDVYNTKKISEHEVMIEGTKLADHAFVMRVMGHLLGKVLTTIEASTANEVQAKAIKDLMRGHFSQEMEFVSGQMFNQEKLNQIAEDALAELPEEEIKTVEIEEVLVVK